jgi:divalent metal cation (Fe/Co/Zn/Cd) transporter
LRFVALTFFGLAAYVVFAGMRALIGGERPDTSTVGLVLLAASVIVMPVLAKAKRRVGEQLGGARSSSLTPQRPRFACC